MFTKKSSLIIIFIAILCFIALSLPFLKLGSFSDEYEQATSGWFILHGLLPYRDFFSHHAPLPLFLGLLGFIIPGAEPILTLRIFILISQIGVWLFLFANTSRKFWPIIFLTMLASAISIPIFNLQMALANTVVYYSLLTIIILLIHHFRYNHPGISLLAWTYAIVAIICFWSSIASFLPLVLIGLILLTKYKYWKFLKAQIVTLLIGIFFFPILYFCLKSFSDFWWSVFKYNTDYYFPLHLAQNNLDLKYGPLFQVICNFLTLLFQNFINLAIKTLTLSQSLLGIHQLILSAKFSDVLNYLIIIFREYMRFFDSLESLIFIGIGFTLIYLLINRKFIYAILFALAGISLFFRSNEIFHLSPLFLLIVIVVSLGFFENKKSRLLSSIFFILLIYNLIPTYLSRLQEKSSYITDDLFRLSKTIKNNSLVSDRIMVVDGNMIYYLLAQRLPSCKYHYYLPWLEETPKIKKAFEACLNSDKTKLVVVPDIKHFYNTESIMEKNYQVLSTNENIFIRKN